jgi:ubiquinone/menaquinone biosynthesis C-methylase UbiE
MPSSPATSTSYLKSTHDADRPARPDTRIRTDPFMTATDTPTPLVDRLRALLDHLGLAAAHVATQMPGDIADLAAHFPERVAGVVLAVPVRIDPVPFTKVADRLLIVSGDSGIGAEVAARTIPKLPGSRRHVLADYEGTGWADVAADRTDAFADAITAFLRAGAPAAASAAPSRPVPARGTHAGLAWRAEGAGPALVLLPFFLAASQWDPVVARLAGDFTVIRIGGAHVGGVATLEDRAAAPSYRAMFHTLVDNLAPRAGERILDVGCGSGALDRLLAKRLGAGNPIEAVDLNTYLLGEAAALASAEGLDGRIRFSPGSATALPFPDAHFGCAFSVTVLEECDARRAISEMKRVVRPGGRIGIVVRAIDMAQWWSFPVPEPLRARVVTPPQSIGKGGVADARLYRFMHDAGLVDLVPFPYLVTLARPGGPVWRYREDAILNELDAAERRQWEAARDEAAADGLLFQAQALHCAVARNPG